MARAPKPKPAAAKTLPADVATMQTVAEVPAPPHPPAEAASATEGVAAPDVALVQPSVDGSDKILPDLTQTGPEGWAVTVKGPAKGRWRAGRQFGPEPVTIPLTELTQDQFDALHADPELVCQVIETTEA